VIQVDQVYTVLPDAYALVCLSESTSQLPLFIELNCIILFIFVLEIMLNCNSDQYFVLVNWIQKLKERNNVIVILIIY